LAWSRTKQRGYQTDNSERNPIMAS